MDSRPFGIGNRRQLNISDIMDRDTEEFKENVGPIFFNGIRVVWPPERTRVDEFTFHLVNGDVIERYYGTDIDEETGDIEDMEIEEPYINRQVTGAGKRRTRKGGRKSRKGRKTRRHRKKSRRHRRR